MNLAKWAYNKGLSLEQYRNLKSQIDETAAGILDQLKSHPTADTGMYIPAAPFLERAPEDYRPFIAQELRGHGVEFIENGELLRY